MLIFRYHYDNQGSMEYSKTWHVLIEEVTIHSVFILQMVSKLIFRYHYDNQGGMEYTKSRYLLTEEIIVLILSPFCS